MRVRLAARALQSKRTSDKDIWRYWDLCHTVDTTQIVSFFAAVSLIVRSVIDDQGGQEMSRLPYVFIVVLACCALSATPVNGDVGPSADSSSASPLFRESSDKGAAELSQNVKDVGADADSAAQQAPIYTCMPGGAGATYCTPIEGPALTNSAFLSCSALVVFVALLFLLARRRGLSKT